MPLLIVSPRMEPLKNVDQAMVNLFKNGLRCTEAERVVVVLSFEGQKYEFKQGEATSCTLTMKKGKSEPTLFLVANQPLDFYGMCCHGAHAGYQLQRSSPAP
jgi:hypothetical protein